MSYTATQKRRVYPGRIARGRMTQALADYQIDIFEAIRNDYETTEDQERLR